MRIPTKCTTTDPPRSKKREFDTSISAEEFASIRAALERWESEGKGTTREGEEGDVDYTVDLPETGGTLSTDVYATDPPYASDGAAATLPSSSTVNSGRSIASRPDPHLSPALPSLLIPTIEPATCEPSTLSTLGDGEHIESPTNNQVFQAGLQIQKLALTVNVLATLTFMSSLGFGCYQYCVSRREGRRRRERRRGRLMRRERGDEREAGVDLVGMGKEEEGLLDLEKGESSDEEGSEGGVGLGRADMR